MSIRDVGAVAAVMAIGWIVPAANAQPANDACANAIEVAPTSVTAWASAGATKDGVISCSANAARVDMWYKFVMPSAGGMKASLCGSDATVAKQVTAFTGCGGTELACATSGTCGTSGPEIDFQIPSAGTYLICLSVRGSLGPQTGILTLTPSLPAPNNTCGTATPVVDGNNDVTNAASTADTQIPCMNPFYGSAASGNDVWYSYTAPESGVRNFEITSMSAPVTNPSLAVFASCGGTLLACDDDGQFSDLRPKIYHLPVTQGTTYLIRFATRQGSGDGAAVLRIAAPPAPAIMDDCSMAVPVLGQTTAAFDTSGLTTDAAPWDCGGMNHDGWFAWTPSVSGMGVVYACGSVTGLPTPQLAEGALYTSIYGACGGVPLTCGYIAFYDAPNAACTSKSCYAVEAGHTYYVRFGMLFEDRQASGTMTFAVREPEVAIDIPLGAHDEPGNCSDAPSADVNGGCALVPPAYTPIQLCQTYKGTASSKLLPLTYNGEGTVDTDWYQLTISVAQTITVTGQSEFPPFVRVITSCPDNRAATYYQTQHNCFDFYEFSVTTGTLAPGTYAVAVSPTLESSSSSTCGHGDRYWFGVTGSEPCPPANENCCRGTTCNSIAAGTCTGTVSGSASITVASCGSGSALGTCCYADFNHDGTQSIDDLFLYFNAYFTGSPWANYGGDGVESPTIDDLFLYINAYFTGCS